MSKLFLHTFFNFENLNKEQSKLSAGLLVDIAKALIVSAIGFGLASPLLIGKIVIGTINIFFAFAFVKIALNIVKRVK